MSKTKRANDAANAMVEAGQNAALIIEACENSRHLTKTEANDVLINCVINFLGRDGEMNASNVATRLDDFLAQLADYVDDIYGVNLYDGSCSET